jgi:peptide/nickel transport system permease protein
MARARALDPFNPTPATAPAAAAPATAQRTGYWLVVWRRLARERVALVLAVILLAVILMAIFAPWVTSLDPNAGSILERLKPIGTPGHWLGTDETGRDLWTRLVYGGRLSILAGLAPVGIGAIIGGGLGILAGYAGGAVNTAIMRTMDMLYAFPSVLLAIAICGMLGNGLVNAILALTLVFIPPITRIGESVTTQVRNLEFVEAARATGANTLQIVRDHVLINVLGPILVYSTSLISLSIILAAGLSFLGLGISPPDAEWGLMLNALRDALYVQPLVAALPGVMIFLVSICFNVVSDGIRKAMDVRHGN